MRISRQVWTALHRNKFEQHCTGTSLNSTAQEQVWTALHRNKFEQHCKGVFCANAFTLLYRTLEVDFWRHISIWRESTVFMWTPTYFSLVQTFNPGWKFSCKTRLRAKQFYPQIEYRIFWGVPHCEMHTKTANSPLRLWLGMLGMTTSATALYEYTACVVQLLFMYCSPSLYWCKAHHCTCCQFWVNGKVDNLCRTSVMLLNLKTIVCIMMITILKLGCQNIQHLTGGWLIQRMAIQIQMVDPKRQVWLRLWWAQHTVKFGILLLFLYCRTIVDMEIRSHV